MLSFQDRLKAAKKEQMQTGRGIKNKWTAAINREASVASTSTLRNPTPAEFGFREVLDDPSMLEDQMELDLPEQDPSDSLEALEKSKTLIVATDFGTTFSSVAFATRTDETISEVKIISNFPEDPMIFQKKSLQVPTESAYLVAQIPNESVEIDEDIPQQSVMEDVHHEEDDIVAGDTEGDTDDDDVDDDPLGIYDFPIDEMDVDVRGDEIDANLPYWGYDILMQARRANAEENPEHDASDIKVIARSKLIASFTHSRDLNRTAINSFDTARQE